MNTNPTWRALSSSARAAALILLSGGVSFAEQGSVEEVLEEVIDRTNSLQSFHAIYDLRKTEEGVRVEGTLELLFDAPDTGRLRMQMPGVEMDTWALGGQFYLYVDGEWRRAPMQDPPASAERLEELFPPAPGAQGSGLGFIFDVRDKADGDGSDLNLSIARFDHRSHLLGWLANLREPASGVRLEEGALITGGNSFEMRVSTEHGFPLLIEMHKTTGEMEIRLRKIELDEDIDDSRIELPDEARRATIDEELAGRLAALHAPAVQRNNGFLRVLGLVEGGELRWDATAQERWASFSRTLHEVPIRDRSAFQREQVELKIDEFADWVRTQREEHDDELVIASLEAQITRMRTNLGKSLVAVSDAYVAQLPALEVDAELLSDLLELEAKIVRELYGELLEEPLMTYFDDVLNTAMGS